MTNKQLVEKLKEDMKMRGFSHYTKDSYLRKAKEVVEYFGKPMKQVTTKELREFLMKYLREEKKISERSINYYNSVIRFIYDVVLDKPINQKQIPMYKKKRRLPKILSEEELNIFFNACDNYMYKTIFMMIYGSGLRISEATDIRVEDIDSNNMRLFVRNGKGERERYTVLPKASLEMLRKCYKMYRPNHPEGYMFLNRENEYLGIQQNFDELMSRMYKKEWITYCKPPFKNAKSVIRYLGRYTHRVAISNNRIIKEENGEVTFKYRDYKDKKKIKEMTITAEEFIRRFLLHILPPRFMKIRHYGLLGNRNKKTKLAECKRLTNTANLEKPEINTLAILKRTLGVDFNLCPVCHKGHLLSPDSG